MITDIVWRRKALGGKVGPFPSMQLLKAGFMGLRESGQRRKKKICESDFRHKTREATYRNIQRKDSKKAPYCKCLICAWF